MESERGTQSYEAFPMKGGDDENSYAHNSIAQQIAGDMVKDMIKEAIVEKIDLESLKQHDSSIHLFRIVDLGCSVGPNTFYSVQNVIEAVKLKFQSLSSSHEYGILDNKPSLEFQVFFNDHFGNDFNTLFKSFPENKQYHAAAVPGSFHNRLFPNSSIHIFHSAFAINYLSKVPKEIVDKHSPAYNKGHIFHTKATNSEEVLKGYSAQFARDMESFLDARASELVPGGLLVMVFQSSSSCRIGYGRLMETINRLDDAVVELSNKGLINDELVDTFNLPIHVPTSEEVKAVIEKNGNFKIEKFESLNCHQSKTIELSANVSCMYLRAVWEGIFMKHFGEEVTGEIFKVLKKKSGGGRSYNPWGDLFVIKRKFV